MKTLREKFCVVLDPLLLYVPVAWVCFQSSSNSILLSDLLNRDIEIWQVSNEMHRDGL